MTHLVRTINQQASAHTHTVAGLARHAATMSDRAKMIMRNRNKQLMKKRMSQLMDQVRANHQPSRRRTLLCCMCDD